MIGKSLSALALVLTFANGAQAAPKCEVPMEAATQVSSVRMVMAYLKRAYIQKEEITAVKAKSCTCQFKTPWDQFIAEEFPDRNISTVTPTEAVRVLGKWQEIGESMPMSHTRFYFMACR